MSKERCIVGQYYIERFSCMFFFEILHRTRHEVDEDMPDVVFHLPKSLLWTVGEEFLETIFLDDRSVTEWDVHRAGALDCLFEFRRRVPPHPMATPDQLADNRQAG